MDLRGRCALVTGAGRRVGQAIAIGLAEAGCDVAIHFNASRGGADETARLIRERGGRPALVPGDLLDARAARELAPRAAAALGGRLDILINAAGIMVRQRVEEVTVESWDTTMDLNLKAYFFVAQGALDFLRKADGGGRLINIADVAAFEPWPQYIPHCISKAGVVMLTQGLARALAPQVHVNAVAPGAVLLPESWDAAARERITASTPLQRLGSPADVVGAVRYLLESEYVTGTTLVVDGGRLMR